jgi:hypothetical protein
VALDQEEFILVSVPVAEPPVSALLYQPAAVTVLTHIFSIMGGEAELAQVVK